MLRLPSGDDIHHGFIIRADIFPGRCQNVFRGDRIDSLQVTRQVAPADFHFKAGQCPGEVLVAAHLIQKVALIEFLNALQFPIGYPLGLKLFRLFHEQVFEFFTGVKIDLLLLFFVELFCFQFFRLIGRTSQDDHAAKAVVGIVCPGFHCKTLVNDILGHPGAAAMAQHHGHGIQCIEILCSHSGAVIADAHQRRTGAF